MTTAKKNNSTRVNKKKPTVKKQSVKKEPKKVASKKDKVTPKKSVTETVKKEVKKKVEIEVTKEDLKAFTFEQMLENNFGKIGTPERTKADLLISEAEIKLIADVKEKLKQEKEAKQAVEEKKVSEPVLEKVLPKGIVPADYIPEDKGGGVSNENKETSNLPTRPIVLYREFIVHQGAEFLNGDLKVQENDTKIARTKDAEYIIYKNVGATNAFTTPFKCVDLAEAELFLDQLIDYEDKLKNTKMENKPEVPQTELPKTEPISEEQKKEIINKYEGLPLQEVDIKELIKAAGDSPSSNNPIANQVTQNNVSNAQTASAMESYADTITGLINRNSFMKMSTTDVNRMLSNQCSRLYNYLLKNDGNGYYIELTQGHLKARSPRDPNTFLNVA